MDCLIFGPNIEKFINKFHFDAPDLAGFDHGETNSPVIPKGELILRLIPTAMHPLENVEYTLNAFKVVRKKLEEGKHSKTEFAKVEVDM